MKEEFLGERAGSAVHHPPHYNLHPSGVETIAVIEHLPGNLCNAVKYAWRCNHKNAQLEDLKKCAWYFQRELERDEKAERAVAWPWAHSSYKLLERVTDAELPASLMFVVGTCVNEAMVALQIPTSREKYRNYLTLALSFVTKAIEQKSTGA